VTDYPTTNRPGRKPFSQQDCIRSLQIAAKSLGETLLTTHKYQTWRHSTDTPLNYPTDRTISSHFETWENALIQARILPPNEMGNLSERRLRQTVEALHQYAERNGFPTQAKWDEFAQWTSLLRARTLMQHTGLRWVDRRRQYNSKLNRPDKYSEVECIHFIQLCAAELGKPVWRLVYDEYKAWSIVHSEAPSIATLTARFGWVNVKRQATHTAIQHGSDEGRKSGLTIEQVVALIRMRTYELHAEAKSYSDPSRSLDAHIIAGKLAELEQLCDTIFSRLY